jgi:hypothetical protein
MAVFDAVDEEDLADAESASFLELFLDSVAPLFLDFEVSLRGGFEGLGFGFSSDFFELGRLPRWAVLM